MKNTWLRKLLLSCLISSTFLTPALAEKSIKLANALSKESHYGVAATALEESLKQALPEKFKVEHFANSALGGEREVIEGVQLGTIDAAILSTGAVLNFVPQVGVLDIPFLFKDLAHARSILDGKIGQQMLEEFPKRNIIALAWGDQGFRHITNNKLVIKTPTDTKSLKIRTTENPVHIMAFKHLGILATPMAWPEVQPALQQGTVDGQENPISVIASMKLNQVQKHLALTGHVYSPALVIFSPSFYNSLTSAEKNTLKIASQDAAKAMRKFVDEIEQSGIASLKEAGMIVTEDVDKQAFANIVKEIYPEYYKRYSKDLIEQIVAQ
ncbi:TRAP transporter substrate-binding protein [Pelistega suis]|uniref:TRAP transporter substrate-binding protein DctP n=1 Tax=Pelistega suis TaxID=1631957 RepID=A0A849P9U3_9BURK|nr:TRAP transporter substrate-binding protein [Pelistega suis]NOL52492.1 TRAP transporter substrate-binding protein DctP [Pelistega suis]